MPKITSSAQDTQPRPTEPQISAFDQPATLGAIFAAARQRAGLTVDEAARILRLRPTVLREIENDDLRSFDHATYARMTLLSYARLLRLPEETVRPWLPKPSSFSTSDFGYLNRLVENLPEKTETVTPEESARPQSSSLGNTLRVFFALCLLIGLAYGYLLWRNLGRLQTTGNATQSAVPQVQPEATSVAPSPQPAQPAQAPANQELPASPSTDLTPVTSSPEPQSQPLSEPPEAAPTPAEAPTPTLPIRPALPVETPAAAGAQPSPSPAAPARP